MVSSVYLTKCVSCGANTSKKYARGSGGKCKECATGVPREERLFVCPDCGERRLTLYQKQHRYHCDSCTRQADPVGYANEVRGFYDT
jgi:predicted RNA-binding Zn-ribbon protein involved in translation (DUF1610 family)